MADGSLKFDTKIDTEGFEKGANSLKGQLKNIIASLNKSGTEISRTFNNASSTVMRVENSLRATEQAMKKLSDEMDEYASKKIPTDEYVEVKKQLDDTIAKYNALQEKQDRFLSTGGKTSSKAYKNMLYDLEQLKGTIGVVKGELDDLVARGKAFTLGKDTGKYTDMQIKYSDLANKADVYRMRLSEIEKQQNKTTHSTKKMGKEIRNTNNKTKGFSKTLKLLKMSLLFSFTFRALNASMQAIGEGFQNLAQYSKRTNKDISALQTSLLTLKNSFATAFSPILTAITPALQTLINYLSQAITTMGQFFAVLLNGATTFTRAKDTQIDYAASLKKSAKEAKKAAAPFDDLIVISNNKGADGYEGPSPQQMFEEVEIDSNFTNMVNNIKESFMGLFEPIQQSWNTYGQSTIDSLKISFGSIKSLLVEIGNSFRTVWLNSTGTETIDNILWIFTNINNTITAIATNFKNAWVIDGSGTEILQHIWDSINNILDAIQRMSKATIEFASGLDFAPILTSFQNLTESLEPLIGTIADGLVWFYENVLLPIAGWVITDVIPLFFDGLAAVLDILNNTLITLKPLGTWLFENFLKPLAEWTGGLITEVLGWIVDKLNEFGDWIKEHQGPVEIFAVIVGTFAAAWGLVNAAIAIWNVIGVIATGVTTAFGAAVAFLTSPIGLVILAIGSLIAIIVLLVKNWDKVKEVASKCWEGIKNAWNKAGEWFNTKVVKPIGDFFTNLWDILKSGALKALDAIKNAFKTVFNSLINLVKTPVNAIIDIINGMIKGVVSGVNAVIRAINSINFTIPDWVPGIGGKGIGFNLKEFTAPKIPKLATGTVVPANYGEFLAILGDNKREAEVVSPLSTMKQALAEVLAETGGGKQEIILKFEGSLSELARILKPALESEDDRVGIKLVTGGAY